MSVLVDYLVKLFEIEIQGPEYFSILKVGEVAISSASTYKTSM